MFLESTNVKKQYNPLYKEEKKKITAVVTFRMHIAKFSNDCTARKKYTPLTIMRYLITQ